MTSVIKQTVLIALSSLLFLGIALAEPPRPNVYDGGNRWNITYYNDPAGNHQQWATQEICFLPYSIVGTSIQGTWYSTSFPDWNGRYYQEGDEIKMTGDYARDVGHDHMTLIHTTVDPRNGLAFKDWTEWREDGGYGRIIGWGNAILKRMGTCKKFIEAEALKISASLPERLRIDGRIAASPGDADLESIEEYQCRAGLAECPDYDVDK